MKQNINRSNKQFEHKRNFLGSVHNRDIGNFCTTLDNCYNRGIFKKHILLVIALFIACFVTSCDTFTNNTEFTKKAGEIRIISLSFLPFDNAEESVKIKQDYVLNKNMLSSITIPEKEDFDFQKWDSIIKNTPARQSYVDDYTNHFSRWQITKAYNNKKDSPNKVQKSEKITKDDTRTLTTLLENYSNIELTAIWELPYTIEFEKENDSFNESYSPWELEDGANIITKYAESGVILDFPNADASTEELQAFGLREPPENYVFKGVFSKDSKNGSEPKPLDYNNSEYVARYARKTVTLTFTSDYNDAFENASTPMVVTAKHGIGMYNYYPTPKTQIYVKEVPYTFNGWSPFLPNTVPFIDTTYTAIYVAPSKTTISLSADDTKVNTSKTVTVTVNSEYSIQKIVYVSGNVAENQLATELENTTTSPTGQGNNYSFIVTTNGTYTVILKDSKNQIASATIDINSIDKDPPGQVTNLTATPDDKQVTLSWTNPTDSDFEKVKIVVNDNVANAIYVSKTDSPNYSYTFTGLTNGTQYTYSVVAMDDVGNQSTPQTIKSTPTAPELPSGIVDDPIVAKNNIEFNSNTYEFTKEMVVIQQGKTVTIEGSNENWNSYVNESVDANFKGAFIANRTVQLSAYAMGAYEVTQELYSEVMGTNPSKSVESDSSYCTLLSGETQIYRPVEQLYWHEAVAFCNELTKKVFGENTTEYAFYSNSNFSTVYTKSDATNRKHAYMNIEKKGYRLPTEAEWEFAARGGKPNAPVWKYAYAGAQTTKDPSKFTTSPDVNDSALATVGWYKFNLSGQDLTTFSMSPGDAGYGTHQVGKKTANRLGLYDMSGNVYEWCYDFFKSSVTNNDSAYTENNIVVNPKGPEYNETESQNHVDRGGSFYGQSSYSCVSYRDSTPNKTVQVGFRVVRSLR